MPVAATSFYERLSAQRTPPRQGEAVAQASAVVAGPSGPAPIPAPDDAPLGALANDFPPNGSRLAAPPLDVPAPTAPEPEQPVPEQPVPEQAVPAEPGSVHADGAAEAGDVSAEPLERLPEGFWDEESPSGAQGPEPPERSPASPPDEAPPAAAGGGGSLLEHPGFKRVQALFPGRLLAYREATDASGLTDEVATGAINSNELNPDGEDSDPESEDHTT